MAEYNYPNVGRLGRFCKGHYIVCQFGYSYLLCRPEDKPHDPLLKAPLKEFIISATYGEQFLQNLHQWKNEQSIINKLFYYSTLDENQQAEQNMAQCIRFIASELSAARLLIIPLDNV